MLKMWGFWVPCPRLYCCSSFFCSGSFVELVSDKPAGDAVQDFSEDGLTDHTLTSICPMWDTWAPYCMCLCALVHS